MVFENRGETVFFTGKVFPVGLRGVTQRGREWVVRRVNGLSTTGVARNYKVGEGGLLCLAKAMVGD